MKKVLLALFLVDLGLALIVYMWKGQVWLINSQVAFLSSSLIVLASMKSYKNMVSNAIAAGAVADDGRDTLEKLEDPYALYDEVKMIEEEKTLVEVVKEERVTLKKGRRSIWKTTKDTKASFSFYRLSAYAILVLGFFYLNSNKTLELIPYLSFLSVPLFIVIFMLLNNLEKNQP